MNHSGTFVTARSAEEVFNLVADPQRFAPLQPDFESMSVVDDMRFNMRIAIAVGQISGHINLVMELREAARPSRVAYRGQGIVAGSGLIFAMQFQIVSLETATQVNWQGEVSVDGMLAFMAGSAIEEMGRRNFASMVERLQRALGDDATNTNHSAPDPGLIA